MNLPNAITVGRIALTPLIAWLPFTTTTTARLLAFTLFVVAAGPDYWDGHLARQHNMVTDLGRRLDPLADKLLLVATLVPMYLLQRHYSAITPLAGVLPEPSPFLFVTPLGRVSFPLWMLIVVLGREVCMTVFRQLAARRGLDVAVIGPAKWKTALQSLWMGSAYCWFFAVTLAAKNQWLDRTPWHMFATFNGVVGVLSMTGAVALTLWSLWLYLRRYGRQVLHGPVRSS